jgi:hypothetical protein
MEKCILRSLRQQNDYDNLLLEDIIVLKQPRPQKERHDHQHKLHCELKNYLICLTYSLMGLIKNITLEMARIEPNDYREDSKFTSATPLSNICKI